VGVDHGTHPQPDLCLIAERRVAPAHRGGDTRQIALGGGQQILALARLLAERRKGIAYRPAGLFADPRNPLLVTHSVADILRARMLAIACGYEDADDLDHLRTDPGFKLACSRLPDTGEDLCSQPAVSRWENAPSLREVMRMTYAMVDIYCSSYPRPPAAVTLDIDDTVDVVHGHQQLSLFNAHGACPRT
jgi:Transposase DDE domain group 1